MKNLSHFCYRNALVLLLTITAVIAVPQAVQAAPSESSKSGLMRLDKNGLNAKGKAYYWIDPSGQLRVQGKAKSWLTGTYKFDDRYEVDPSALLSSSYQAAGHEIAFDNLQLTVIAVDPQHQQSTARGRHRNGEVIFVFDTSDRVVDLVQIHFRSHLLPVDLKLKREG